LGNFFIEKGKIMAISVNKVMLVGILGADPEIKGRDSQFVTLRVATAEYWKDKQTGERQERTQWHNVAVFNEPNAKFLVAYAKKGDRVFIEGQLETRKWERGPNDTVFITEVVVKQFGGSVQLQSKDTRDEQGERRPAQRREEKPEPKPQQKYTYDDDEIPF
jgi:single-strand DNA-binding protein